MGSARARTRLALVCVMATAAGVAGACASFSGADSSTSDAGDSQDASTPVDGTVTSVTDAGGSKDGTSPAIDASFDAGPPPTACDMDAANAVFCDSFEQPMVSCGSDWMPVNGTGTIMTGGAHGGSSFCRFCPTSVKGELDHTATLSLNSTYIVTAWVRSGPQADASWAPNGTTQIFAYPAEGGYVGRSDKPFDLTTNWVNVQNTLHDASLGTHELINFYEEPFGANSGQCIDVDDVILFREP